MEHVQTPDVVVGTGRENQSNYYRAIVILLAILLGILVYFYYLVNRPPTSVDKKPLVGYEHLFSIYGHRADRLARPTEVAVDTDQNIYVADTNNHRIMIFNADGGFVDRFGNSGDGPGRIKFPSGLAVDSKKNVYVVSRTQNKMIIYNSKHKVAWEVSVPAPLSVTTKGDQVYLTTDRGVMIGNSKGQLLSSFGKRGAGRGNVDHPTGIAVDGNKRIFLADSLNYRVQAFNSDGKVLWILGKGPKYNKGGEIKDKTRTFGLPAGLTLGGDGNLYLVDAQAGEIHVLNAKGRPVAKFGEWGHDDGQFYYPAGIAYMGGDRFVVADKFNDRVQVIRYSTGASVAERVPGGLPVSVLLLALFVASGAIVGRSLWRTYVLKKRAGEELGADAGAGAGA